MKMSRALPALSLLTVLFFTATNIQAEIYKWTDKNGQVHYSDKKPDKKTHVDKIKVSTGKGTANNSSTASANTPKPNTKEKEQALQKKAQKLANKKSEKKSDKKDEATCSAAKTRLNKYAEGARLRINDNGQMRFLTPQEIQDRRANTETYIAENC